MKLGLLHSAGKRYHPYLLLLPLLLMIWAGGVGWLGTGWLVERGTLGTPDQVLSWARYVGKGFWALILLWMLPLLFTRGFYERFVGPATPEALGAIRALMCLILLLWVVRENLATTALLPASMFQEEKLGLIVGLYNLDLGFWEAMRSPTGCWVLQGATILALILGMVGRWTRLVLPVAFVGCLVIGAILRSYSFFWHQGLVPIYVLGLLCLLPCGDAFSWDRRRRVARGRPVVDPQQRAAVYGWSRWLIWTLIATTYVMAGASKLRTGGIAWWEPDNMRRMLLIDALGAMNWEFKSALWLDRGPSWWWAVLGFMGVFGEVIYGLVPFWRPARWLVPLMTLGMHIGILLIQNILFLDLIMIQAIFFNYRPMLERLRPWLIARGGWWARRLKTMATSERPAWISRTRRAPRWGLPGLGAIMLVAITFIWMQFIEVYPFTGMRMYSNHYIPKSIHYNTVEVAYEDGRTEVLDLGDWVNALGQARFRPLVARAFEGPQRRERLTEFLDVTTPRINARLPEGKQVEAVIFTQHVWDYVDDRHSETYGRPVSRYEYYTHPHQLSDSE